jgi:hypothetical protein
MSDKWRDMKKTMIEETESQITELPDVGKDEKEFLADKVFEHLKEQFGKALEDRRFYEDDAGGTIVVLRMPKKSVSRTDEEKKAGNKGLSNVPKVTSDGKSVYWWGPKLPLMKGAIATAYFPKNEWEEPIITKGLLWEPEDTETEKKTKMLMFRGRMTREDRWLSEAKTTNYHRPWSKFKKEAEGRYEELEIESIYDVPDGDLDRPKYTFNVTQLIKVL